MPNESRAARKPWKIGSPYYILGLLCVAAVSSVLDRFLLSILVQPIQRELGLTDVQLGLLHGIAFALFYATLGIPIAHFADRGNRRRLIAMGLILWSIATAAGGLATGFLSLFAARMFVGIGEAALNPAAYSILADKFDERRLARAIGIFQSALQMATGLSIVIGGALFAMFVDATAGSGSLFGLTPWRLTMITLAIPGLILAFVILITMDEPDRKGGKPADNGSSVTEIKTALLANRKMLLIVILGYCPMAISGYGLLTWYPTFLIRLFDYQPAQAAFAFGTTAAISGLVGSFLGGAISDALYGRFGRRAPLVVLVGTCGGAMATAVAPLMQTVAASLAVFALGNLIFAMSNPLVATLIQLNAPANVRARVSGVWVCMFNLAGFGLGPLLVASLTEQVFQRPDAIYLAMAINSATMLALAFVILLVALRASRGLGDAASPR